MLLSRGDSRSPARRHHGAATSGVDDGGSFFTAPVTSEDERAFLTTDEGLNGLLDIRALEQVLQQFLGRMVWVVEQTPQWGKPVPFE